MKIHKRDINETLLTAKQGKTDFIEVHVNNPSNHEVTIQRRTLLGRLQLVRSITAIPVKMREEKPAKSSRKVSECYVSTTNESQKDNIPYHLNNIDLMALTPQQRLVAVRMLI